MSQLARETPPPRFRAGFIRVYLLRLKTLPIALGLPFGVMPVLFGHLPLPAKITVRVLPPIDLGERYGSKPDIAEIDRDVRAQMQDVLSSLAEERRLPVLG